MTLNGVMAVSLRYFTEFSTFGSQLRQINRIIRAILSATVIQTRKSSFGNIWPNSDIRRDYRE